jgi:hypothetical protein
MRSSIRVLGASSLLLLSACASQLTMPEAERLALYRNHAGEPVDSIVYLGGYDGWTPLGDGALALWTRPNEAWLVQLQAPCSDLDFADTIGFRADGGRLSARLDRIYVSNNALIPLSCTIQEIRPLDVKAVRAAEREDRARRKVEAST